METEQPTIEPTHPTRIEFSIDTELLQLILNVYTSIDKDLILYYKIEPEFLVLAALDEYKYIVIYTRIPIPYHSSGNCCGILNYCLLQQELKLGHNAITLDDEKHELRIDEKCLSRIFFDENGTSTNVIESLEDLIPTQQLLRHIEQSDTKTHFIPIRILDVYKRNKDTFWDPRVFIRMSKDRIATVSNNILLEELTIDGLNLEKEYCNTISFHDLRIITPVKALISTYEMTPLIQLTLPAILGTLPTLLTYHSSKFQMKILMTPINFQEELTEGN